MSEAVDIAVVGASGFLGSHIFQHYAGREIVGTYSNSQKPQLVQLDITQPHQIRNFLQQYKPKNLFWVSANKNVNDLEKTKNLAESINTKPVVELVKIMEDLKLHSKVVFFSTDYVFSGKRGQYSTSDQPDSNTEYGKSKLKAEQALMNSSLNFKIIRTSAILGKGGNFFDWAVKSLGQEKIVEAFSNTYFSPTPIEIILRTCDLLIEKWDQIPEKILNVCYPQKMSRYEVVSEIKNCLGVEKLADIKPIEVDFVKTTVPNDISLVPSNIIKELNLPTFKDLLKKEISR